MSDDSTPDDTTPAASSPVQVHDAKRLTHPGGMGATRAFPSPDRDHLDPFVLFERFHIAPDQGFGTHPHRGFEIVSYVLDGAMAHADSMGHESVAEAGDAMYLRTGSGMQHSELPAGNEACSGLQLWVNLPRKQKSRDPAYADASADALPRERVDGATVTTVVGEGSPLDPVTEMAYHDVTVDPGESWTWMVSEDRAAFLFVVSGNGALSRVDGADPAHAGGVGDVDAGGVGDVDAGGAGAAGIAVEPGTVATVDTGAAEDGVDLEIRSDDGVRVAAVSGVPHGDPIRQRGPFVD